MGEQRAYVPEHMRGEAGPTARAERVCEPLQVGAEEAAAAAADIMMVVVMMMRGRSSALLWGSASDLLGCSLCVVSFKV